MFNEQALSLGVARQFLLRDSTHWQAPSWAGAWKTRHSAPALKGSLSANRLPRLRRQTLLPKRIARRLGLRPSSHGYEIEWKDRATHADFITMHGGSGVTLSWGTAAAVDLGSWQRQRGAWPLPLRAVGLATAWLAAERSAQWGVRRALLPADTSDVAAPLFSPPSCSIPSSAHQR